MDRAKKWMGLLLAGAMCFSMAACNQETAAPMELAMVTDSDFIDDQSFNQGTYEGMVAYANANDLSYYCYIPEGNMASDRIDAVKMAVDDGATCVLLPGYVFAEIISQVQEAYDQVSFLVLDVNEDTVLDCGAEEISDNVTLVRYREEQAGYLAGYATVMDGYTHIGFLGGEPVPSVVRYGYGFVQGAEDAAKFLGVDVVMEYDYSDSFVATPAIKKSMDIWYQSGVEVVFACGGGIYASVLSAAESNGGRLIGVDTDQGNLSPLFLSSAMKDLGNSAITALTALKNNGGAWPDNYAGSEVVLGAEQGSVGLATRDNHWRFDNFTLEDYQILFSKIASGDIVVSDGIETKPSTTKITVNYVE